MNTFKRPLGLALTSLVPVVTAWSQDDANESVFELSPFVVDGSGDTGYRANNTLAGSRLNTQLKDVAASVTALTNEFLEDIGATDVETALAYVVGAETNQTVDSSTATAYTQGDANNNPSRTRIRGLTSADVTSDFFLASNTHFDTYNSERVELVRGPNSVLFGLGSPAGILNYATKKASIGRNSNELGLKVDNFGTIRTTIDANRILMEDKLAVRLMGLYNDERFQFDNAFDRDKRGTVAITYQPTERTAIQIGYEDILVDARRPRYSPPTDGITEWIAAGRPTYSPIANVGKNPGPAFDGLVGADAHPVMFFTDPNSATPQLFTGLENFRPDGTRLPASQRVRFLRSSDPDSGTNFFVDPQVSDTRMFPIFDQDLATLPGTWQSLIGDKRSIVLNQNLGDNLNVEVGYYRDQARNDRHSQIIDQSSSIQIDVNETLPNGTVNPNFLRPFIFGRGVGRFTEDSSEQFRAQVSFEYDFAERNDNSILGRHRLSALYTESTFEKFTYAWEQRMNGFNEARTSTLDSGNRRVMGVWYVGPAFTADQSYPTYTQFPQVEVQTGQLFPYQYYDPTTKTWKDSSGPMALERMVHRNALWDISETDGIGFALQSFWWNGKIVTTLGWRDDEVSALSTSYPEPGADGLYSLDRSNWSFSDPATTDGDSTVTTGAVYHATEWLSFHYNESENFVVSSPKVNILGERIPGSAGVGKDYGFTLNLIENKLSAKINWYETAQTNAPSGGVEFAAFWRMRGFEQGIYNRIQNGTITGVNWINWDGTTDPYERFPNVSDVNDYEAEGMEVELTYNPSKNWRVAFNASKQETVQTNTGAAMLRYIELRQPFWDTLWDQEYSSNRTVGQEYSNSVGSRLFPALAANGRVSQAQAKWNWNAVTNYSFSEGRLKGVSVGGSARWNDKRAVGYAMTTDADGNDITDLDKPFFSDDSLNIGVHAAYRRKIMNDKVDWRIQMNIKNLVGDDDLVVTRINPDGRDAAYRIGREPIYELSNTFKF